MEMFNPTSENVTVNLKQNPSISTKKVPSSNQIRNYQKCTNQAQKSIVNRSRSSGTVTTNKAAPLPAQTHTEKNLDQITGIYFNNFRVKSYQRKLNYF